MEILGHLTAAERTSYADITAALKRRFGSQHQVKEYRARFHGRMRGRGGSLQLLVQNLELLAHKAYPGGRGGAAVSLGNPQLTIHVKQVRVVSQQEALEYALGFEIVMLTNEVKSTAPAVHHDKNTPLEDAGSFRGRCWGCGKRGYSLHDCLKPSSLKTCGRPRGRRRTHSTESGRSSSLLQPCCRTC